MTAGADLKKEKTKTRKKKKRIDKGELERQVASTGSRFQAFQRALTFSFDVIFLNLPKV